MLPVADSRFAFLGGRNPYTVNEVAYSRLKSMKLRGELSQGLVFPVALFAEEIAKFEEDKDAENLYEFLGCLKYEPQEDKNCGGNNLGSMSGGRPFPSFICKTDQERLQNIISKYHSSVSFNELFEMSYKLDGSSITVFIKDGVLGICSRNIWIHFDIFDSSQWIDNSNAFVATAISQGVIFNLILYYLKTKCNIALQGELVGPGIQQNFEGLDKLSIYFFDVFDIDRQIYLPPYARRLLLNKFNFQSIPIMLHSTELPADPYDMLAMADGPSGLNGEFREGLVMKSHSRDFSFKAIGNSYLLKRENNK